MCAKKRVQNIFHHISITFLWQWNDSEREEKTNYFGKFELQFAYYFFLDITFPSQFYDNLMESYIPQYFSKLISIPLGWKCDGTVVKYLSWKIEPSHFHHIFMTMRWCWKSIISQIYSVQNLLALEISSKSDKKVMTT